jgi:hypothetical protein
MEKDSKNYTPPVEDFISTIRDSFIGSQQVYTEGSCYHFYLILKSVFPNAEPYYDLDHIITKINDKYYDITGEVRKDATSTKYERLPSYPLKAPYNIYKDGR